MEPATGLALKIGLVWKGIYVMPDMQACHTKYVIKLQTLIGVEFSTAGFLEQNCSRYACIFFQRLGTPDLITDPA